MSPEQLQFNRQFEKMLRSVEICKTLPNLANISDYFLNGTDEIVHLFNSFQFIVSLDPVITKHASNHNKARWADVSRGSDQGLYI